MDLFDRNAPRKSCLLGGVKGHNIKRNYLTGKPPTIGRELHEKLEPRQIIDDSPATRIKEDLERFNLVRP